MNQHLKNIFHLGIKEIIELGRDGMMVLLIVLTFSLGVMVTAKGEPESVQRASIAIVDEDHSELSERISEAFLPPLFLKPVRATMQEIDVGMDNDKYTFSLIIPSNYQRNVASGKNPELQLNADATRMTQAFVGSGYIEQIIAKESSRFLLKQPDPDSGPAQVVVRNRYNPNLTPAWHGAIKQLVITVSMLAIILIGAALIRERESGTLEHLMVMPVTVFEIMCAKIWSMTAVVLIAAAFSLGVIMCGFVGVPCAGSPLLFFIGVALHLFAMTSLGLFLACVADNMPQMGMFLILVLMPLNMLSGLITPRESMPQWVQDVMQIAPTTHFVEMCRQILLRGAGLDVVWKPFTALFLIGAVLFVLSLKKFNKLA
ncbi:MAG: ABC transporter permease [Victivallaceae bacterium]|nr:ABC transporter permease [Victivallaceae bacterium]